MDTNKIKLNPNPREGANIFSVIFFKWLFSTYYTGYKKELEVTDLHEPLKQHASDFLGNRLFNFWIEEYDRCQKSEKKCKPSLMKALIKCFGYKFFMYGFRLGILELVVRIAQPFFLSYLLKYFRNINNDNIPKSEAFFWGSGLVIDMFLGSLLYHTTAFCMMHKGMKIRVACCSIIYRKLLKISRSTSDNNTSAGQIINLLSNDVNRLDYSVFSTHYLWIAPAQTIIIAYFVYKEVGCAVTVGFFVLLFFVPILIFYGKFVSNLTLKLTNKTDERLKLTNEIIKGIKVIKMYAWEKPFALLINKCRKEEMKIIRNNLVTSDIIWSFDSYVPRISIFLTILTYIFLGSNINAEKVFLLTTFFNMMKITVYRMFPLAIKERAEALISIKRIQSFLMYEETWDNITTKNIKRDEIFGKISFKNVTVKWNSKLKFEALKNVSFNIKPKTLTAIIGQVGAGKTSIFQAILSEISDVNGKIEINGKISYASQEPWIFTSSLKKNILFGKKLNEERYKRVIEVCQLKRDLQLLPYGENTLASEKGSNLSGGQCARINLARAVYHEADIYLLDDPLSAVDVHVGKNIFQDCVKNFLKDKTVVLITHQHHLLKHADKIIYLEEGRVCAEGSYSDLLNSGLDLKKIMKFEDETSNDKNRLTMESVGLLSSDEDEKNEENDEEKAEEVEESESKTLGSIGLRTYKKYLSATGSIFLVFFTVVVCIFCQLSSTGADYFVTYWVNVEERGGNFTTISKEYDVFRGRGTYIYTYGTIVASAVIATLVQAFVFFYMCMQISKNLHAWMFDSVIHAKMSFFNANPVGRVINRFSKDIGIIDTRLPQTVMDVLLSGLASLAVVTLVLIVNLWFLIPVILISSAIYKLRKIYIKPSRSIKRLEGTTRSPVFNHVGDSIQGLATIRALRAQNLLTTEFDQHQDLHSSTWFLFIAGSRAFGMYIEILVAIFLACIVYTLVMLNDVVLAGNVGLVITQVMMLIGQLQWGIRQTTELENQMTSVERILEYSDLPRERVKKTKKQEPLVNDWPSNGRIVFKNVGLQYERQIDPSLKNLNFVIEPNEMIGIVGRTGAGKSSIINAVFRLADITGEIYIDEIATSKIALQDLRSKISIIPQEPVLFTGTLRKNLDPFEEYSDDILWRALEDVELKGLLDSDLGLDLPVEESGSNFSVGQRQLLCLARAVIRNNKILALDEATANVDPTTDELIQRAIRRKFKNCTVLVVAHRLNTVMDADKILVMDAGRAKEYDHPYKLLQMKNGIFNGMVKKTGTFVAKNLYEIAESNYINQEKIASTRL